MSANGPQVAGTPKVDARGPLSGLLTSMAWGATGVWVNLAPGVSPLALVGWRLVLAAALFLACFPRVRRDRRTAAAALGALLTAYYVAAVFAFQHAPVAQVSLCIGCAPLFVLLYSAWGGQRPTRRELLAVVTTLAGLLTMVWPGLNGGWRSGTDLGLASALGAGALTAAYAYRHRALALRAQAPSGAEIGRVAFVPLGLALLAIAWAGGTQASVLPMSPRSALAVLGLGVISTAVPTLAIAVASSLMAPLLNTLIRLTTPLFAAVFGWVFLGQPLSWRIAAGACLILAGLFLQALGRGGAGQGLRGAGST